MTAIAITSGQAPSPRFDLASVEPGKTVVVDHVTDLGGSLREFTRTVLALWGQGSHVRVTGTPIDTSTPAGELMLDVLVSALEAEERLALASK